MNPLLNDREQARHRRRNQAHSALLLGGMVGLIAVVGWIIAGPEGVLWTLLAGGLSLVVSPRISPRLVLRLYRAQRIAPHDLPAVTDALVRICRRAGLPAVPTLHYIPSPSINAFAVGTPADAAIAVTDGLLRRLSLRELVGVLAHEISHIRNNDLWVMGLADMVSRLTRIMSLFGLMLLVLSLPVLLEAPDRMPWLLVLLLMAAPTIGSLLQLALSRTREFDADLDAAGLTQDPAGLASALDKMERIQGNFWEDLFPQGRRIPDPSLLRTHPDTQERVRRLLALRQPVPGIPPPPTGYELPAHFTPLARRPRWRFGGYWY